MAEVLVAGPDGSGKSTVVEGLVARAAAAGMPVERVHWRPGAAVRKRSIGPVVEPHAAAPQGLTRSAAKSLAVAADFLVAAGGRWRHARRQGLVVIERGWPDMAADPRRYRVDRRMAPIAAGLCRVMPKADVVLLLLGDPAALHARKPELPVAEIARQTGVWRSLAPRAGRRVVELDTVSQAPEAVVEAAWDAIRSVGSGWRAVPFLSSRLDLRVTDGFVGDWGVYRPHKRAALVASRLGGLAVRAAPRTDAPVDGLDELLAELGVARDHLSAVRSSAPGRTVVGAHVGGRLRAVVKVGPAGDLGLHREAEALRGPAPFAPPLVWAGTWRDRFVVATSAVAGDARLTMDEVLAVCNRLVDMEWVHGDLAPWNASRSPEGVVLFDWEASAPGRRPLFDLAHYVVQEGALLGRRRPAAAVDVLTGPGSPGRRHLEAVGEDPADASKLLLDYLRSSPSDAFRRAMEASLS